jgi:hypothetical protein
MRYLKSAMQYAGAAVATLVTGAIVFGVVAMILTVRMGRFYE